MSINLVEDFEVLWAAVQLVGTPPAWAPNTNYNLGDTVVPTSPQAGQENIMFQCVGFLGKSDASQPVFPATEDNLVEDNQIEWQCVTPSKNIPELPFDRYYLIDDQVTLE